MQTRSLVIAAVLAAASFGASAVNVNLGNVGATPVGFGDTFPTSTPFFSDTFMFTPTATTVTGSTSFAGIGDFTLLLLRAGPLSTVAIDTTPGSFSFSGLTVGTTYALQFLGYNTTTGAAYNGTVTAVPEPETFALMLAGLGSMGALALRRRRS